MAVAVGGLILVQRLVPIALRREHNDVAGFIYAVLGVTYAVLLGLMVVAVWEQWEVAKATADDEASSLAEIFWIADRLPEADGYHIQELCRAYAREVVNEEWPLMEQEKSSPRAWDLLDELRASLQDFDHPRQESRFSTSRAWSACATSRTTDETGCSKPRKDCRSSSGWCSRPGVSS